MRNLSILLAAILSTSCALQPFEVQKTPLLPNQAVVFDIDGTLTPGKYSISTARDDAAAAVRSFADKGYKIIYLSARITFFQSGIPNWLKENQFPEGSIHVPEPDKDSSFDPVPFKERILNIYKAKGWEFAAAYGDQSTDFKAYVDVGIPKAHVFALQRSGETCDDGVYAKCLRSWAEHMDEIKQLTGYKN